jgi:hypothetical protein
MAGGVAQGVGPEFKLQHQKNKNKNKKTLTELMFCSKNCV